MARNVAPVAQRPLRTARLKNTVQLAPLHRQVGIALDLMQLSGMPLGGIEPRGQAALGASACSHSIPSGRWYTDSASCGASVACRATNRRASAVSAPAATAAPAGTASSASALAR